MNQTDKNTSTTESQQPSKAEQSRTAPALTPEESRAITQEMCDNINRNNQRERELAALKGRQP